MTPAVGSIRTALSSLFRTCYSRLLTSRVRLKGDFGQAKLRFIIIAVFIFYLIAQWYYQGEINVRLLGVVSFYLLVAGIFLWWAKNYPRHFLIRRLIIISSDNICVSACLLLGQSVAIPLLPLYLWVTVMNGFRFGLNYLIHSGFLSLLCVYAVFWTDAYWRSQWELVFSTILMLLLITVAGCLLQSKNLVNRKDSEHEQAFIRIVITSIFSFYFVGLWLLREEAQSGGRFETLSAASVLIVLVSIAIFLAVSLFPEKSPFRRVVGIMVDIGASTFALVYGGEYGAPLIAVYLWVSMGNGFRYGEQYLIVAALLSLAGFAYAVSVIPFWKNHLIVSLSIAIVLLALPVYMASLIRRLNSAIAQANQANRAKTQFLANMSHELRTPLNAVIGMGDLLIDANINDYEKRLVGNIQSSANTLLRMIERILDIAKIESGKMELHKSEIDLYKLIYGVKSIFEAQIEAKGLKFEVHISPLVPKIVMADESRLKQILINLIGNASKFTEEGFVKVAVYLQRWHRNNAYLIFEVKDTGIGIPESRQKEIFEPFAQADDSITRRYGGTGLGMSIARQLVEAMDGVITVYSEIGRGTSFKINLSFLTPDSRALQYCTRGVDMHCYFLRDQKVDQDYVENKLNWLSIRPLIVLNANEFVTIARRDGLAMPGLVIADELYFNLSHLDIVIHSIRETQSKLIRVVVVVDENSRDTESVYLERGCDYVLNRPLREEVVENIGHLIDIEYGVKDKLVSLAEHYGRRSARKLNILIAEDNKINQMVIREVLEKVGHEIILVEDGEKALDSIEENEFDLAIVDVNMPKVSGLDVVKVCRFNANKRSLPIIMLSADATTTMRGACENAGADCFITKPFDARQLLDTIAELSKKTENVQLFEKDSSKQPTQSGDAGVVDFSFIGALTEAGVQPSSIANLLREFSAQGEQQIVDIQKTVCNAELHALKELLHSLKGSSTYLGAVQLVSLCEEAENLIRDTKEVIEIELVEDIKICFRNTCSAFDRYIDDLMVG